MTPRLEFFANVGSKSACEIRIANDSTTKTQRKGTVELTINKKELIMSDVLHVPDCAANLLSVSKICEKGNKIVFDIEGCSIFSGEGNLIAQCKPENGVYKLTSEVNQTFLAKGKNNNLDLWHRRLGHLNYESMRKMRDGAVTGVVFENGSIGLTNCVVCGKTVQTAV